MHRRTTWLDRRALQLDAPVLKTETGTKLYRQRRVTIEPGFGQTKHNLKFTQSHRRGRGAVRTEWRLLMMTHNLAKLHRHHLATTGA